MMKPGLNALKCLTALIATGSVSDVVLADGFFLAPKSTHGANSYDSNTLLVQRGGVVQFDVVVQMTSPQSTYGGGYQISYSPELVPVGWIEGPNGDLEFRYPPTIVQPGIMENGYIGDYSAFPHSFLIGTISFVATQEGEFNVELSEDAQPYGLWADPVTIIGVLPMQSDTAVVKVLPREE